MNVVYKFLLIIIVALSVASCGGDSEEIVTRIQFIESSDSLTYVNNSEVADNTALFVTSAITGATVYIQSDLSKLVVGGSNNIFYFSDDISVRGCEVEGNDNTAETPDGFQFSCTVTGIGNIGFD